MKEKYLLTGQLEETNDAYSIAKIAGLKMCEYYGKYKLNYKSLMPPNLYGPNDNYDRLTSHFYPALIKKIHFAKANNKKDLIIWGSGKAKRELMFVEDFADALIFFMNKKIKEPFLNIGTGRDYTINWYANFLMKKMNKKLKVKYDKSKPDGMPKKCLDISLAKGYGWRPIGDINKAFEQTYKDFLKVMNLKNKFLFKVVLPKKQNYYYPLLDNGLSSEDLNAGIKVLKSGRITMGKKLYYLKKCFKKKLKSKFALMVNSGSSANLLAVFASSNPKRKINLDEVIML